MVERLNHLFRTHRDPVYLLLRHLADRGKGFLLWSELGGELDRFLESEPGRALEETDVPQLLRSAQEAVIVPPFASLALRRGVADWWTDHPAGP